MAVWRKLSLKERPTDLVVIILLSYFLFSCWCIEIKYCSDGLAAEDKRFMMPETYAFAKEHNPLFLSGPGIVHLRVCQANLDFEMNMYSPHHLIARPYRLNQQCNLSSRRTPTKTTLMFRWF